MTTDRSASRAAVGALDIGGTKIIAALVDPSDRSLIHRRRFAMPGPSGAADPGLRTTLAAAEDLVRAAERLQVRIAAVGAGFPEYVRDGRVTSDEVLGAGVAPDHVLEAALGPGIPLLIDADVRLGAIAEAGLGAGRGVDSFVYVSWGTGLSATLVIDGACWPGAHGEAIALGEFPLPAGIGDPESSTLEGFASGTGIARRYAAASGVAEPDGARAVLARRSAGDAVAAGVIDGAATALGLSLAAVVRLLDPVAVIMGGGLGSAGESLLGQVVTAARPGLADGSRCRWLRAGLGPDSVLIGAALLAERAATEI
ncbi:ROK family protein [Microlunatus speluncae]|uniref:ROK family protein n=1 Tax=Microlunatus speluncae TaxID=2594267 RepID=UPI00126641A5|nr:ROK family protein [Microlunatus speluncae]